MSTSVDHNAGPPGSVLTPQHHPRSGALTRLATIADLHVPTDEERTTRLFDDTDHYPESAVEDINEQ
jgi:hypothetical protein